MERSEYAEISYVELIAKYYPTVYVKAMGDGSNYNELVYIGGDAIPPKVDLDLKILEYRQEVVWDRIKTVRDKIEDSGVAVDIGGTMYWFHSDVKSLIKYIFLILIVVITPSTFPVALQWKTMTGVKVTMNISIVLGIFNSFLTTGSMIFEIAEQHRAAMLLEADPYSYDFTTGWPVNFGA